MMSDPIQTTLATTSFVAGGIMLAWTTLLAQAAPTGDILASPATQVTAVIALLGGGGWLIKFLLGWLKSVTDSATAAVVKQAEATTKQAEATDDLVVAIRALKEGQETMATQLRRNTEVVVAQSEIAQKAVEVVGQCKVAQAITHAKAE